MPYLLGGLIMLCLAYGSLLLDMITLGEFLLVCLILVVVSAV